LIRQSGIDAACAKNPKLKKRAPTRLYNDQLIWLKMVRKALDVAVLAV